MTLTGECSEEGYCTGTSSGQYTVTGYVSELYKPGLYAYEWEGQYLNGTLEAIMHDASSTAEFSASK
jgi:hypothetical protein